MDDPAPVGGVERARDLDGDVERLVERQRSSLEPALKGLSLQALHHEKVDLPLGAHVIDGADVRVARPESARASRWKRESRVCIRPHVGG